MEQTNNAANLKAENVSVHNFAELDLPVVKEQHYEDFVIYGEDNLFPIHLIEAWLQSSTHNALTIGISQMIAGKGLNFDPIDTNVEVWRRRINRNGETLGDLINKTAFDLYLHGYFAWKTIWNQARTAIVEVYHVPAETVRSGKADESGQINDYYVSWDWTQYRKKKFKPKRIKAFDPADRSEGVQLLFTKQYRPSQYYYSTPSYIGALNWILLDNRVSEFHLNNIENGFFPSSIIQFFNGEPPQEEKRKIELNFMSKFTGKKAGKLVFVYNNNRDDSVQFDTHEPANLDRRFREMMPEITRGIMIGHRVVSPMLFGVKDSTGWGNNAEEIQAASVLMNKTVIVPFQKIILDALQTIFRVNGWGTEISIESLQPAEFLTGTGSDADAVSEFSNQENGRPVMPDKLIKPALEHLDKVGTTIEDLEKQGYVLTKIDDEFTPEAIEQGLDKYAFSSTPDIEPVKQDIQSIDEAGESRPWYIVRYQYRVGVGRAPIIDTTRTFCRHMIETNSHKVYTRDEIGRLKNPEFGEYDIFIYKGSYNCRHRWARLVWSRVPSTTGNIPGYREIHPDEIPVGLRPPGDDEATRVNDPVIPQSAENK